MAVSVYATKKGPRFNVEAWVRGKIVAQRAGFLSREEAKAWEEQTKAEYIAAQQAQAATGQNPTPAAASSTTQPEGLASYQAAAQYLLDIENRVGPGTFNNKKTVLQKFLAHVGPHTPLTAVTKEAIKEFLAGAARDSKKKANSYRTQISGLFTWACREELARSNPVSRVQPYPVEKYVRRVPTAEAIESVLAQANEFEHDFITAFLHTGARHSEMRLLRWQDVDFDRGIVRLWTSKRKGGNKESRALALSPTFRAILERLHKARSAGCEYVFVNPHTGTSYGRQSRAVKYMFEQLCMKAGVQHFTAHSLRHYVATYFSNDPRRAQKILGHNNLSTTEIYLHELGVDTGAIDVFERITNGFTNRKIECTHHHDSIIQ